MAEYADRLRSPSDGTFGLECRRRRKLEPGDDIFVHYFIVLDEVVSNGEFGGKLILKYDKSTKDKTQNKNKTII